MKAMIGTLLLLSTMNTWANTTIDQLDWRLNKAESGIEVYSAKAPSSSHKAVLAITTISADMDTLVGIIRNPKQCKQWVYRCKQSYLYESTNAQEDYTYTSSHMPFPVKNRDVLARIQWQKDPATQTVTATGIATQGVLEEDKNQVRITDATMIWELTPLNNGEIKIRSYAHLDPAGAIPAWVSNTLAVDIPVKTLRNLKKALQQ